MEITLLLPLIAIVVLLLLSAFFSGSETAMTAVSSVRMHSLARKGNKKAALVNKIREKKDRLIGALLLGNNFVNIMASALATSVLIKLFGESGVVIATFIMTVVVLIFSEVLPKTYALHHADRVALKVAKAVSYVVMVFSPVTEAVAWIVRNCLRFIGIDISKVHAGSHLELLRGAIEMHEGPEEGTQEQRAMLRSILDLFEVDVEEIMVHRRNVTMIDGSLPVSEIVAAVLDSPFTRLPVWKDDTDNIIGMIHAKLLIKELMAQGGNAGRLKLSDVLLEPWFIPETTSLYEQLQAFRERKEHFAVVVDEYGVFQGIVTLEDILEEIVGEIDDEHDVSVAGVRRLNAGTYMIDGSVTIRDLNREFEWGLPDGEYSTLAGLVIYESKTIPEVGQSFMFHGFRFDIVRRHRNQITLIRLKPPKAKAVSV